MVSGISKGIVSGIRLMKETNHSINYLVQYILNMYHCVAEGT